MFNNTVCINRIETEPWKVTILYTGENTMTGSRIKKAQCCLGNEPFMLTYGDGVSDIDINALLKCHKQSGKYLTLTIVKPNGRFGVLDIDSDGTVTNFAEKKQDTSDSGWINGGYMVCEPEVFNYITPDRDDVVFEKFPIENLVQDRMLNSYKHRGFWYPMDTLKGKNDLNEM